MKKQRYELTGEWSGPRSPAGGYTAFQHREYTTDHALVLFATAIGAIQFTDGTCLHLHARPMKPGERPGKDFDGYGKLIRDCKRYNVDSVSALCAAQNADKILTGASR